MTPPNTRLKQTARWLAALGCALTLNLADAALPSGEEALSRVGVPQEHVAELDQGKAITWKYPENTDKELADGVAVYVQAPLAKVVAFIKKGEFAGLDSTINAHGELSDSASAASFKRFTLGAKEAQALAEYESGDQFNLSAEEAAGLKGTDAKTAEQKYREILLGRYQAYRKAGLSGVAPYARDGGQADPGAELRTAAERDNKLLKQFFPDLYQAWANYPQPLPAGVDEGFFWHNRTVEGRPTATLAHRLIQATDEGAVVLIRQFFVGHSYNSSNLMLGCLPYRDGALVFYALRSSTDQVAGMGSGMKHSIGRGRMKDEMVKQMQRLRTILK